MKTLFAISCFLISGSAFAIPSNAILDCSLSFGPDQQVTVLSTPGGLMLEELTNTGSFVRRPLSEKEFKSAKILLRQGSPLESGTLTFENGSWVYDLGGSIGNASCSAR